MSDEQTSSPFTEDSYDITVDESGEISVSIADEMLTWIGQQSFLTLFQPLLAQNEMLRESLEKVMKAKSLRTAKAAAEKALKALPTPPEEQS